MCNRCYGAVASPSRRRLLTTGLSLAGLAAGASLPFASALAKAPEPAPHAVTPQAALNRILEGNARYASNIARNKDFSAGRMARARSQHPIASILSCADSRVAPELLFDQGPGDLFVVRVAGNFVNDDGLASLEYGVEFLDVPLIVVLGHSGCGAVAATLKVIQEGTTLPGHLPELVQAMRPGIEAAIQHKPHNLLQEATDENVRYAVRQLESSEPIIKSAVAGKKIKVVGGYYDIATGTVKLL
jgi:carbonic anhydrase